MTGIEIEYLLGIYFTVVSIARPDGRLSADAVKLVAGLVLIALAVFGKSFI